MTSVESPAWRFEPHELLKQDLFGTVERGLLHADGICSEVVRRDARRAHATLRWLARLALGREARALRRLSGLDGVPRLVAAGDGWLARTWIDGVPMHRAAELQPEFFDAALVLVERIHAADVAHNDLHKEPNWLQRDDGSPAIVDFQLASVSPRRGPLWRRLVHEDRRYVLKHKRTHCPDALSADERAIVAHRWPPFVLWRHTGKKLYNLVTRRLLRWSDDEGRGRRRVSGR